MSDTPDTPGATPPEELPKLDKLARVYIKMRDKMAELNAEVDRIKEQQAEVAAAMKDLVRAAGGESVRTPYGTVTLKTSKRYVAQDWDAMHTFILAHQAPYLLEKRIAQSAMESFLEENPSDVPPGLNTMSEVTVSVTKPRK